MRLPNRKPGKYTFAQFDPNITATQLKILQDKLVKIKKITLPQAIADTQKYGENGDFSENAEYQIAKGRLRGLNRTVTELQQRINQAAVIQAPKNSTTVQIGHTVTLFINQAQITYTILGSTETNPSAGIISYQSPLGAALIGHKVGDKVIVHTSNKNVCYTIMKIK